MKRSEMVAELEKFFWDIENIAFSPSCNNKDIRLLAEQTLEFIEKANMLPPCVVIKDAGMFKGDNFEYITNEWESEYE